MNSKRSCRKASEMPRATKGRVLACSLALLSTPVIAGTAKIGEDVTVDYVLTTSYAVGQRVGAQSPELLGQINADDSDRSFKKGSLVNNRVSLTGQVDIKRGDFGLFMGGSTFYDAVYRGSNDNNSQATLNRSGPSNLFSPDTRYFDGSRTRLLDSFVYGSWQLGEEQKLSLKLGNHLVAWGENIFYPGISGGQSRADATKGNIPGVETKDVLLPTGQVSGQLSVNKDLSVMAYVQYNYKPTELQPTGDYLFQTDAIGPGAEKLFFAPGFAIDRTPDIKARNSGQWGLGARYRITPSFEVGVYHLNYHEKVPAVEFDTSGPIPTYHVKYFEDVKATALSFTTRLGDASVGGELGYHDGLPVQVNTGALPVQIRGKAMQAQVNMFSSYGPNPISDQTFFLAEIIGQHLISVSDNPFGATAQDKDLTSATRNAWGYQFAYIPSWKNVFTGWDLATPFAWNHTVKGIGVIFQSGMINGGDKRASVGATFTYLANLEVALKYNAFLGKPGPDAFGREIRPLADRDFVSLNVKYSF